MTDAWRNHLNNLAKRSPIDPAHFFELKSTLAYGPSDSKIEERKAEEQIVEQIQMPMPQPAAEPIIPAIVAPATSSSSSHSSLPPSRRAASAHRANYSNATSIANAKTSNGIRVTLTRNNRRCATRSITPHTNVRHGRPLDYGG